MKKVFLSLAALAFVATGTVSCSSDDGGSAPADDTPGNDDTPGGDDTPGTESNVFNWDGADYAVDTTTTGVIVDSDSNIQVYELDTDGDGEADEIVSRWIVISHEGTDFQTSSNDVWTNIYVPVDLEAQEVLWPHEATEYYLLGTEVYVGGESVADPDTISAFDFAIDVWDEDGEQIVYTTSTTFAEGTVNVDFDGFMDGPYGFTLTSGTSVSSVNAVSKSIQLEKGNVDLNNAKKINNANMIKVVK